MDKIAKGDVQNSLKFLRDGTMSSSVLSSADTPKNSETLQSKEPMTQSLFNPNRMKESKFRTTTNLKTLMKGPVDVKLKVHEKTKKATVRDINNRSDLAADLLNVDRFLTN
jgi:hypothetical protein